MKKERMMLILLCGMLAVSCAKLQGADTKDTGIQAADSGIPIKDNDNFENALQNGSDHQYGNTPPKETEKETGEIEQEKKDETESDSIIPEDSTGEREEPEKNSPQIEDFVIEATEETAFVTTASVNVRMLPSLEGEVLELLKKGTDITVTGFSGEWYQISYHGTSAFVFAEYAAKKKVTSETMTSSEYIPTVTPLDGTNIVHKVSDTAPWIVIDAGHQKKGNSAKEPVGPGADTMKAKVSSGTCGQWTKVEEYKLNLTVALKLRDALLQEGYNVIMIRETHDVDISNAQRALIANEADADVFIRIHANGSDNASVYGMMTICPTAKNPYCSDIYQASRKLSDCVLTHMMDQTGAKKGHVWETDTMSGINWCNVPVTIVEMGYMSNKEEDYLLQDVQYQEKLVKGMVEGIREYLGE